MCSDRGTCNCGKCLCNKTEDGDPYTGHFCEIPPVSVYFADKLDFDFLKKINYAHTKQCNELKDCVQCKAFNTGPLSKDGCQNCGFDVTLVELEEIKGLPNTTII